MEWQPTIGKENFQMGLRLKLEEEEGSERRWGGAIDVKGSDGFKDSDD